MPAEGIHGRRAPGAWRKNGPQLPRGEAPGALALHQLVGHPLVDGGAPLPNLAKQKLHAPIN